MSEVQALLVAGGIYYAAGAGFAFIWGYITYTTTRDYPMLDEYEWELRWGARAMIFCWAWPLVLAGMHAPKVKNLGRFIGGVFRDGMRR